MIQLINIERLYLHPIVEELPVVWVSTCGGLWVIFFLTQLSVRRMGVFTKSMTNGNDRTWAARYCARAKDRPASSVNQNPQVRMKMMHNMSFYVVMKMQLYWNNTEFELGLECVPISPLQF